MTRNETDDALAVTNAVIDKLIATLDGKTGSQSAQVNYRCGDLRTNAVIYLNAGGTAFWRALVACFDAAVAAGSTFELMDIVRATAEATAPSLRYGIAVKNFSVRVALAEQGRILAKTNFASRQDVDRYFDQIDASFELAERVAADNLDNTVYSLLITLHAAVSNDLANRSRPLPRIVSYSFTDRMPSLWIAQRVYRDPSRNDELLAENKPIHPLFMPQAGVALSA